MQAWRKSIAAEDAEILEKCRRSFPTGERPRHRRIDAQRRAGGRLIHRRHRRLDASLESRAGLPSSHSTGKGLQPYNAAACHLPQDSPDLSRDRVAVTPFHSGYRLGSTMEFAGYDESLRPERLQLLKDGSTDYLKEPHCEPVLESWFGCAR